MGEGKYDVYYCLSMDAMRLFTIANKIPNNIIFYYNMFFCFH